MPKFVCPKDDHEIAGCGTAFEAEPERDGTVECPDCGVRYDVVTNRGLLPAVSEEFKAQPEHDGTVECPDCGVRYDVVTNRNILPAAGEEEEGSCPDRAAFGSCTHESCAEADRTAVPYFECHDCGGTDHPTSKCPIEKTSPRENEGDSDDEDLPGISPEERAQLQAIDNADASEHRPGVGKIVCKFCGLRSCDYDCDGSQTDEIAAENEDAEDLLEDSCCEEGHDGPAIRHKNGTISCEACGFTTDAEEWDELFGPVHAEPSASEQPK